MPSAPASVTRVDFVGNLEIGLERDADGRRRSRPGGREGHASALLAASASAARAASQGRRASVGSMTTSPVVPSSAINWPGAIGRWRHAEADHGRDAERPHEDHGVVGRPADVARPGLARASSRAARPPTASSSSATRTIGGSSSWTRSTSGSRSGRMIALQAAADIGQVAHAFAQPGVALARKQVVQFLVMARSSAQSALMRSARINSSARRREQRVVEHQQLRGEDRRLCGSGGARDARPRSPRARGASARARCAGAGARGPRRSTPAGTGPAARPARRPARGRWPGPARRPGRSAWVMRPRTRAR